MKSELLNLRKNMKKRKPSFIRQDAYKRLTLGKRWKKPRGLHSKLRIGFKGKGKSVEVGYKFPKAIRGLSKNGLVLKRIFRIEDLSTINNQADEIIIEKTVGVRKKINIIKECIKLKIKIYNLKNSENYIKEIEEKMKSNKEKKIKRIENNKKKKNVKIPVKQVKEEVSDEDKKREEKKEKDKLLTRKE